MTNTFHLLGHVWSRWEDIEFGQARFCQGCGLRQIRACEDMGHTFPRWGEIQVVDGMDVQYRKCKACGRIEKRWVL